MNRRTNQPPAAANPASARQNEYFVPRDGIDREVITSDICRYLGNDALVRPGTYESPEGRVTQGYFITAYRNLTSAMIQDLKADSARWEQERRAASRTGGGGAGGSREQPRGQADYATWKNQQLDSNFQRQQHAHQHDAMDVDPYQAPPPNMNPGYSANPYGPGPTPGYAAPPYAGPPPGASAPFPGGYGYPPTNPPIGGNAYSPPPTQADRYPGISGPPIPPSYGQEPAFVMGSNYNSAQGPYGPPVPNRSMPISSAPPSRPYGATAGGPSYGGVDSSDFGYGSGAPSIPNQMPFGSNLHAPTDVGYGRNGGAFPTATTHPNPPPAASDDLGSPAGTTRPAYGAVPPEPPFDEHNQSPALPNAPTPTNSAPGQLPPAGQPAPRRDADPRDRDRHREQRDDRGARRTEPDRGSEDRHAAERARHRQHR